MNLIKISDTVMVNADMISTIELKKIRGGNSITITVEGRSHVVENKDVLKDLIKSGINLTEQYFAG